MSRMRLLLGAATVTLLVLPAAAGSAPRGNASVFTDTAGDASGGQDVRAVNVSNDDRGNVTIDVGLGGTLQAADHVFAFFDADRNAATGSPGPGTATGADYSFAATSTTFQWGRWENGRFVQVTPGTHGVSAALLSSGVRFA